MKNHSILCGLRATNVKQGVKPNALGCLALASLLLFGAPPAHAGQIQPAEVESALLVNAVNSGDYATALEILRAHGITNGTLLAMAARLGQPTQRVALVEPFLKAWEPAPTKAFARDTFLQPRVATAAALGYPQMLWIVESAGSAAMELREAQLRQSVVLPIGVMDVRLRETNVVGFIQWYDRYAENLHSVALNLAHVNSHVTRDQAEAYRLLNTLFQLVKARKPDAFVWLAVQPSIDDGDVRWLQTMRFGYDGLLVVGTLVDFRSDFEGTRALYLPYVGVDRPMVIEAFAGFNHALRRAAKSAGGHGPGGIEEIQGAAARRAALEKEAAAYAGVGKVVGPQMGKFERRLQTLGYRGLILDSRLVRALSEAAAAGQ